ncbi:MAG: response regulator [Opitutales bacterium]|nr:response regulator [Opitutales bacterium]
MNSTTQGQSQVHMSLTLKMGNTLENQHIDHKVFVKTLIVDDSTVIRKILAYICEEAGLETTTAEDGEQGLELLITQGPFQLLLVDWEMPNLNGLDMVRRIKDENLVPGLKILMITTHNTMGDVVTAMSLGIDDYLMKPIDEESVVARLQALGMID